MRSSKTRSSSLGGGALDGPLVRHRHRPRTAEEGPHLRISRESGQSTGISDADWPNQRSLGDDRDRPLATGYRRSVEKVPERPILRVTGRQLRLGPRRVGPEMLPAGREGTCAGVDFFADDGDLGGEQGSQLVGDDALGDRLLEVTLIFGRAAAVGGDE